MVINQLKENPTIIVERGGYILKLKRIYRHILNPLSIIKPYKEIVLEKQLKVSLNGDQNIYRIFKRK
jgi:hypothetical protein